MHPLLTTIVPATDRPATLSRTRSAIDHATNPPEEVIVVEVAGKRGATAARNAGARQASGDVLVFVDADVAVHPDAFDRIRNAFAEDPELTAMLGSYDQTPGVTGIVAHFRNLLHHHVHQGAGGRAETFWTGLGAIRREAFEAAGGFRVEFMEDVELGMRLADGGALIKLDPDLQGTHLKTWTLPGMVRTDLHHRGAPWVATMLRRRRLPSSLNLAWLHRVSALLCVAALGSLIARRPGRAAGALGAFTYLNRSFYALLMRRRGPREAAAGVALHVVHHLTAVASVPLGAASYARERRRSPAEAAEGSSPRSDRRPAEEARSAVAA